MDKNPQTSLGIFFESLEQEEKELLSEYISEQKYERLSEKFDKLLGIKNENQ